MDPRGGVQRMLELQENSEGFDEHLDDTAMALLTDLCTNLAYAMTVAQGRSHNRGQARECAAECLAGIAMVLEVWEMADAVIIGGPDLDSAELCRLLSD